MKHNALAVHAANHHWQYHTTALRDHFAKSHYMCREFCTLALFILLSSKTPCQFIVTHVYMYIQCMYLHIRVCYHFSHVFKAISQKVTCSIYHIITSRKRLKTNTERIKKNSFSKFLML